jgi:hypothetical protein
MRSALCTMRAFGMANFFMDDIKSQFINRDPEAPLPPFFSSSSVEVLPDKVTILA